jgi:hypothetical protein
MPSEAAWAAPRDASHRQSINVLSAARANRPPQAGPTLEGSVDDRIEAEQQTSWSPVDRGFCNTCSGQDSSRIFGRATCTGRFHPPTLRSPCGSTSRRHSILPRRSSYKSYGLVRVKLPHQALSLGTSDAKSRYVRNVIVVRIGRQQIVATNLVDRSRQRQLGASNHRPVEFDYHKLNRR